MTENNREKDKKVEDENALIAHWAFDEGKGNLAFEKISAQENYINYVFNQAKYRENSDPLWRPGIKGKALLFDGYSNYIESQKKDLVKDGDSFTIEVWLAPRSFEAGLEKKLSAIVNQHDKKNNRGFILGLYRHGLISFQLGTGDQWVELWSKQQLSAYQWSYLTASFDSDTGIISLYLNGKEIARENLDKNKDFKAACTELLIAKNNQPVVIADIFSLNMYAGLMDELKLYNRALSSEEINDNFKDYLSLHAGEIPELEYDSLALDPAVYAGDPHRPQFHPIAPGHWMNEPHGPIYFNGQYHLFYQHNPRGPYWHQIHWGHWVSEDMVHWRNLPIALTPEKDAVDPDGDWSGSATYDQNGLPALFFTAGNANKTPDQGVAIARTTYPEDGDNDLVKWKKPQELAMEQPENIGLRTNDFRDPFVWKEGKHWYCLVGSGVEGEGGTALIFESSDFENWEYKGHLYRSDYQQYPYLGPVWELPVLLPLRNSNKEIEKHIFLISPVGEGADVEVFYWIGQWDKETCRFIPDHQEPELIDYGDFHFTGPSGMVDPVTGRSIVFTIAQGERSSQAEYDAGWAHNGGLPVSLFLRDDGELGVEPIEELKTLRKKKLYFAANKSKAEVNKEIESIQGDLLEIKLELETKTAPKYGIKVRKSPQGEEETLFYYDKKESLISVDRTKTSMDPDALSAGIQSDKIRLEEENLILQIYIDKSMIETYINSKKMITTRAYPLRNDSLGLEIYSDGEVLVKELKIWEMDTI